MIRPGRVVKVDILKFNFTFQVFDGALALVGILVNSRLPINNIKSKFACNSSLGHSLDVRGSHTD
jgi:hypothetical protein